MSTELQTKRPTETLSRWPGLAPLRGQGLNQTDKTVTSLDHSHDKMCLHARNYRNHKDSHNLYLKLELY